MRRPAIPKSPVVVKIGTSSLAGPDMGIDRQAIRRVVDNVESAWSAGHPTVLVTSGAIAAGLPVMGLSQRPPDIPEIGHQSHGFRLPPLS